MKTLSELMEQPAACRLCGGDVSNEGFCYACFAQNLPTDWESCTKDQLQKIAKHGSYGQRMTATRLLGLR